jgi:hypothetical protein
MGTLRRTCPYHLLIPGEGHLRRPHSMQHRSNTRILRPVTTADNAEDPDYAVICPTFS